MKRLLLRVYFEEAAEPKAREKQKEKEVIKFFVIAS
jgi:hypothetical protein